MKKIETIEEIRAVREEISKKCDYDPKKLVDYYMAKQEKRKAEKMLNKSIKKR